MKALGDFKLGSRADVQKYRRGWRYNYGMAAVVGIGFRTDEVLIGFRTDEVLIRFRTIEVMIGFGTDEVLIDF